MRNILLIQTMLKKNMSQYESKTKYYKTVIKGIVFQLVPMLWTVIVIHQDGLLLSVG